MNFKSIKAEKTTLTRDNHDLEVSGTGNLFETIVILSKRSKQLAIEMKDELNSKLEEFITPTDSLEEVFEKNKGYDENRFLVEDYDFWLRAIAHSRFYQIRKKLYKYRRHDTSLTHQIANNNVGVLNMLNVKYVIQTDSTGNSIPTQNPNANGNAWFVKNLKLVQTADEEMKALDSLDSKNVAVFSLYNEDKTEYQKRIEAIKSNSGEIYATITMQIDAENEKPVRAMIFESDKCRVKIP